MLIAKINGKPFTTEYPMPSFDRVPPNPAVKDLSKATIALCTSGGIVPKGNPDHIESSSASHYGEYDITGVNDLTAEMITKAALNGDPLAIEAYEYTGMLLGHALADAVTITSPEAIFLFGGLAKAGKYIFEPTKKYMEMHMMPVFRNKVKLLPSGIDGKNAAVLGASALVWQSLTGKQM